MYSSKMTTMENKRYYFIDNIRWVVVLLVLLYHVFYNYNALGVFGGIGGFSENQWQDTICMVLNPWFMALLFIVAGASSRYALNNHTTKEFRKERTRKLLVPSTIGLLVFGWILGLLNMCGAGAAIPANIPPIVKWFIAIPSGIGPLWFIQDLFVFSLLLLLVRRVIDVKSVDRWLSTLPRWGHAIIMIILFGVLLIASKTQIDNPTMGQGLINLYRPIFYFVCFIIGYYIFSSEAIHSYLAERAKGLIIVAIGSGIYFVIRYYGMDYTLPIIIQSVWCNLFCWATILAMFGASKRWADKCNKYTIYLTQSSFGIYIVHMTICTAICLTLKATSLPVWSIYLIAILVTYTGSFATWELLRRIPLLRWCIFGIEPKERK